MDKILVEKMTINDVDNIMIVENLSFSIPWSKSAFVLEFEKNTFSRYLVAKSNNIGIGYIGMWKVYDEGHITNIAVHPEFRGEGIGKKLIWELIKLAKDEEIAKMTLEVRRSNIIAQNLYKKFGFVEEGFRKSYYADNGEDAIIMWKYEV